MVAVNVLLETQEPMPKPKHFLLLAGALTALVIVTVVGVYAWAYLFNRCEVEAVQGASAFLVT
jgi:hypothetical protein